MDNMKYPNSIQPYAIVAIAVLLQGSVPDSAPIENSIFKTIEIES